MPAPRRRDVLAAAGASLSASLAGCSGVLCRSVAGDVSVHNDHDERHAVEVTLKGPTTVTETYDVPRGTDREDARVVDESGDYEVIVRVDGEPVEPDESNEIGYESGSGCPRGDSVSITIDENGSASISIPHVD